MAYYFNLKDYIYIPLGGNKQSELRTYSNLLITFILGGIWHGAGWTFLFWGFLHGSALVIHRVWKKIGFQMWSWFAWFLTFNFANISWVFFRAETFEDALKILKGMFGMTNFDLPKIFFYQFQFLHQENVVFGNFLRGIHGDFNTIFYILAGFFIVLFYKNSNEKVDSFNPNKKNIVFTVLTLTMSILYLNRITEFLYFNF
jgi:alginate O-acetyltransferase complex protein AlgI